MIKTHAIGCQFIDMRSRIMILLTRLGLGIIVLGNQVAVGTHTFPTHVISHNDNDIGFISKKR